MAKTRSPKLTSITDNGDDLSKHVISENITAALDALESTDGGTSRQIEFVADAGAVAAEIFRTDFMAALEEYLRNSGDVE